MAIITFSHKGNFHKTKRFLENDRRRKILSTLKTYGEAGVAALSAATPVDSGKTATSWRYEIEVNRDSYTIYWINDNVNDGVNIAVILQYGHGTGTGGYIQGTDYINPSMKTVFDDLANAAWREVMSI